MPATEISAAANAALSQIADLLGCPIEMFTDASQAPAAESVTYELLDLWNQIERPEDQARIMDLARALAGSDRPQPLRHACPEQGID